MVTRITQEAAAARRAEILQAARWCFLNFGFAKTSLDDIAKRANISRTLLYKTFKDKEDIFVGVFTDWLVSRQPAALAAASGPGSRFERLRRVCTLLVLEPWDDMAGAPMAAEFYDVCDRVDSEISSHHRDVALQCATLILGDAGAAEVLLLALDGQLSDQPSTDVLARRIDVLCERFTRTDAPSADR